MSAGLFGYTVIYIPGGHELRDRDYMCMGAGIKLGIHGLAGAHRFYTALYPCTRLICGHADKSMSRCNFNFSQYNCIGLWKLVCIKLGMDELVGTQRLRIRVRNRW